MSAPTYAINSGVGLANSAKNNGFFNGALVVKAKTIHKKQRPKHETDQQFIREDLQHREPPVS